MGRTATILLVLAGALGAREENLLPPGDWGTRSISGHGKFETVRGKKRGSKALKVTRPAPFGKVEAAWRDFTLPRAKRDGQIRVSALVRGEKLGNAWLRCLLRDEADADLGTTDLNGNTALNGTFKWTRIERLLDLPAGAAKGRILLHVFAGEPAAVELKLPPGATALTVALALEGTGRVWFDDVALEGK